MANAGQVQVDLYADDTGLQKAFRRASATIASFGNQMNGKITEGLVDPLKKSKFEFKDMSRIVGGIIVSKVFYTSLNAIRNATGAVIDFRKELEYTEVAFSNLFDDANMAEELVNVLKDFSAVSPFDFESSADAAQRLLAYGIQAKNVMYVMQGVMNAATMQGDPSKIESISRALGQIYTKGTLKAEELRQLAEAGIPAYEILSDKLNLSAKAMENIGKAGIPASVAINALVDGINERFSGMAEASTMTMKGIVSNIKDNALMIISGVFDPLYQQIRTLTRDFGNFLSEMYKLYELKGLGGIFEKIVPNEEDQAAYRQTIALMQEFGAILLDIGRNVSAIVSTSFRQLINIINALGPYFILAGQAIQAVVREARNFEPLMKVLTTVIASAAGAFIVFKAAAFGAFILKPLTSVVMTCAKAFAFLAGIITAHPLVLGIILLGGAIAGLATTSTKAGESIKSFGQSLTKWLGIDPGKKILPDTKKRTADVDKFNNALDTTADKLDKTGDEADKAAKKAKKAQKDLLSFDEVFRLNNKDETNGSGGDVPDWTVPDVDLGGMNIDEPILPDFTELWESHFSEQLDKLKTWAGNLWSRICDALGLDDPNTALFTTAFGTGLGLILAALLGGTTLEMFAAALLGGLAGILWEKIAEAFGMDEAQKHQAAICTAFGLAIGALVGAILGLPVLGIVAASLGAGLVAELWAGIADACGMTPDAKYAGLIAGGIAALIAAAFNNPLISVKIWELAPGLYNILQAALGGSTPAAGLLNAATTVALVTTTISTLISGFKDGDWSGLIPTIAGILGRLFLGPLGAWGGMVAGYIYNATYTSLKEKFNLGEGARIVDGISAFFTGLAEGIAKGIATYAIPGIAGATNGLAFSIVDGIKGGIAGAIIAIASSAISNVLLGWLGDAFNLTEEDVKNGKVGGQIGGLCGSIIGGIVGALVGGPAGAALGMAIGNGIGQPIGTAIGGLWNGYIAPALTSMGNSIATFFTQTLPTFFSSIPSVIAGVALDFGVALTNFGVTCIEYFTKTLPHDIGEGLGYTLGFISAKLFTGFNSLKTSWDTFWNVTLPNTWKSVGDWFKSLPGTVDTFMTDMSNKLHSACDTIKNVWTTFWSKTFPDTLLNISKWWHSLPEKFSKWAALIATQLLVGLLKIKDAWNTFWTETLPATWDSISSWFTSLPAKAFNWMLSIVAEILRGVQGAPEKIKTIADNIIQGFIDGLNAKVNAVAEFITGFIDGFIRGFKDGLGIHSPSTVFADIGGYVIEGFLNGLSAAWETVTTWTTNAITTFTNFFSSIGDSVKTFASDAKEKLSNFVSTTKEKFSSWASTTKEKVSGWASTTKEKISNWVSSSKEKISGWVSTTKEKISGWVSSSKEKISGWTSSTKEKISTWSSSTKEKISSWATSVKQKFSDVGTSIKTSLSNALSSLASTLSTKLSNMKEKISSFATSVGEKLSNVATSASEKVSNISTKVSNKLAGHATGGVFNREHIASISEGNKAEAIIPLEDKTAMQPFVDAVSQGLAQYLGPIMANMSNSLAGATAGATAGAQQPLYVGTLIADDRSLRELQRKMNVIQLKETRRTS